MDYNPLIPNATTSHDVAHILSESFEETIRGFNLTSKVAENFRKNNVDEEYLIFKEYGEEVKQFSDTAAEEHSALQAVETKMMMKQGKNMILQKSIEDDFHMKEDIILRRDGIFQSYPFNVEKHNLIDKKDVLPSNVEQSIDFVYNKDYHTCKFKHCTKIEKKIEESPKIIPKIELSGCDIKATQHKQENIAEPLRLEPKEIVFENFEINTTYKKKIRLQNCSTHKLPFFFKPPNKSPFSMKLLSKEQYLAPGMYVEFLVTFCTKIYHNYSMDIEFSTSGGYKTLLKVTSFRKPPHLRVYIFRSLKHILHTKCPGNLEFWERRCTALNDTIDCGHCFIGGYNYLSLIIGNIGSKGHFFCLTEDEWISGNINNIDHTMQFTKDCFKIFPSYITVEQDEVAEICVTFTPNVPGLHIEKLYLISDNNTAKAVEIIGDGLYFSKSMIQARFKSRQFENIAKMGMEMIEAEEFPSQHCFYMGYIENLSSNSVTFTVSNKSAMYLNFYWTFRRNEKDTTTNHLDPKCVHMKNTYHEYLSSYTTYDFDVDIVPEVEEAGHYSIIIGFYIEKIPENALEEGEEFIIRNETESENIKFADVQIFEVEFGCEVYFESKIKPEKEPVKICDCPKPPVHSDEKVEFSCPMLDFGIIPIGVKLERYFDIHNLSGETVEWRLVEIVYDVDVRPSMYVAQQPSTNISCGILKENICGLKYYVNAREPRRWVSVLLLLTGTPTDEIKLNSICMVTYEVIDWDIRIFSKVSNFPIVCSLNIHYVGIKYKWSFFIKNYTPLLGCFWLFPPTGDAAHMLDLQFHPKFGVIRPGEKIKVSVTVIPKEIGIIENIFVPCFFSRHCPPIMIRFLCAVDDVNIYFYIPSQAEGYDKILWPPKVLNEVDFQMMKSTERLWTAEEEDDYVSPFDCKNDEQVLTEGTDIDLITDSIIQDDSLIPSSKNIVSNFTHASSYSYIVSLVDYLKQRCRFDFMKQDYVVEIRDVPLRKPQKFSFYIENVTPINAEFVIETTNFEPCLGTQSSFMNAVTMIYPSTAFATWDEACGKNGIVVIADTEIGMLQHGEVIQINMWVYATTWGIYSEEIVVNINNLTPFYFNAFIEVNGPPVEFPMAKNTIRTYPTLRFGHIPYMSDTVTQILKFKNTSCIPLAIQWFLFDASKKYEEGKPFNTILDMVNKDFRTSDEEMRLFLSNKCYGQQDNHFMQVHPRSVELVPGELSNLEIKIDPNHFPVNFEETNITCNLVGYIFLKEEHKNQHNLVFRRSADDFKPLHVEILATIAMPLLKLDMIGGKSRVSTFATDIINGIRKEDLIKLTFKNTNLASVFVAFHVELPFVIVNILVRDYDYVKNVNNAEVKPGDIVEIHLICDLEPDKITMMGNWIYSNEVPVKEKISTDTKMVSLHRHLNIHQRGILEQSMPVFCEIFYPRIEVSPLFLKFNHLKIGTTRKLLLHLYNWTKVDIEFEIRQTTNSPEFTVKPDVGTIPKAVGLTRSFVDIFVYFKPTYYHYFQESIIIQTKIPQCWLEVPMNGYGIQNEKFDVDYYRFQP